MTRACPSPNPQTDRIKCKPSSLGSSLHIHACRNGLVPADSRWIVIQWSATRSPGCIQNGERGNRIIGVVAAQSSAASLLPSVADFFMRPITRPCLPDLLPKLPRSCLSLDGANRANDSGIIASHRPEKKRGRRKPQTFMFAVLARRSSHPLVYTASFLNLQ